MKSGYLPYPLEWLDQLITVTFNPDRTDITAINHEQIAHITKRLPDENLRLQSLIKSQIFSISKEREIKLLIQQYHSSLIILLDQTLENQNSSSHTVGLKKIYKDLLSNIGELLSFIETRFHDKLSLEERVPKTYVSVTQDEIKKKMDKLKLSFNEDIRPNSAFRILLTRLDHFVNSNCLQYEVTFRDIFYKRALIRGLEDIDWSKEETEAYSSLDELLIYLNYNSKAYMNLLTDDLAARVNSYDTSIEKMEWLLFYYKAFNQLHRKPGMILNPNYHDLETIVGNWFTQEILYLEKKLHLSVVPLQGKKETPVNKQSTAKEKQNVLCMLSTDQIGLILRASDELRVLVAKSMSQVFKTIVPHLSTPYKEDLSYDGMRSKSYVAEERDKQIAIETLERIIKKIKEY